MKWLKHSMTGFLMVGVTAALTHYLIAVITASLLNWTEASANVCGFACAFPVSYFGHRGWSFRAQVSKHNQSLPRFFVLAFCGFFANQLLVLGALRWTPLPFWIILALVMLIVAASTYLLSRYWAFRQPEQ